MTGRKKKRKRRRCRICGELFMPNPRVAKRQTVCSKKSCQLERKKQSVKEARRRDQAEVKEENARKRIFRRYVGDGGRGKDLLASIDWDELSNSIGPEAKVLFEEIVKRMIPQKKIRKRTK